MKRVTIKDLAKKLNVSVSTVSRAFNDKYDIRKETRDLILKTADEMGYYPNPIAKKLCQQKTYNIGVVVPEFINEFYAEIIIAIQEVLMECGYQVLIMQSDNDPELELKNVKTLLHAMVDGIIIAPISHSENVEFYLKKFQEEIPMVFVNRVEHNMPASKVIFDNVKWSFFATEHLIRQGFQKIYHLSAYNYLTVGNERTDGFKQAMKKHRISPKNYQIIETGLLAKEGEDVVNKMIAQNSLPDAFYCANDLVALGAMKALTKKGLRIPQDIGVMGFTNTQMAELSSPQLCSVKQPTFEMGRSAAQILLKQLKEEDFTPITQKFDGKLIIRETSVSNKG